MRLADGNGNRLSLHERLVFTDRRSRCDDIAYDICAVPMSGSLKVSNGTEDDHGNYRINGLPILISVPPLALLLGD